MEERLIQFTNNYIERRAELRANLTQAPEPSSTQCLSNAMGSGSLPDFPPPTYPLIPFLSALLYVHTVFSTPIYTRPLFFILLHDHLLGVCDYIDTCQIRAGTSIKLSYHVV